MKNRSGAPWGRFGAIGGAPGTLRRRSGSAPGRSRDVLGRPQAPPRTPLRGCWLARGTKLALERRFGCPGGAKLALERRFGRPGGAKLALEWRFGRPGGAKLALERRFVKNSVFPRENR